MLQHRNVGIHIAYSLRIVAPICIGLIKMSNVEHSGRNTGASRYHARVLQLEKELDQVREASFKSIRDLEAHQEAEKNSLKEKFNDDVKNLTLQYEKKLKEQILKIETDHERKRQTDIQSTLKAAEKEWAEAEELRFKKFQVDLVHAKSVELAECEAYWRAELSRLIGFTEANENERRQQTGRRKNRGKAEENEPGRGAIVTCALILAMSVAALLYVLAPQGKASVKPIIQNFVSKQDADLQNTIYTYVPWLKTNAEEPKHASDAEAEAVPKALVRAAANLRDGPNLVAGIKQVLGSGVSVHVLEVRDDWSRVAIGDKKGESGWIHNSLLTASK